MLLGLQRKKMTCKSVSMFQNCVKKDSIIFLLRQVRDTLSSRSNTEKFFSAYSVMAFASFSASSIPSSPIASGVVQKGKIKLPFVNILP